MKNCCINECFDSPVSVNPRTCRCAFTHNTKVSNVKKKTQQFSGNLKL